MNYYERYCGDYGRDTAHLSLGEHGAYTLLLDAYYSTERPLLPDFGALYRICRAMSKGEQASVRAVADEFFPIGEDGLRHNGRADRDIAKALPRIEKARRNGTHGGRPKKPSRNPAGYENETQQKPSGLPDGNPAGYPAETQPGEASPHAMHQPPSDKAGGSTRSKPKRAIPDDFGISPKVAAWAIAKGYDRLQEHLEAFVGKAKAKAYRYADWDEAFMGAIRDDWAGLRKAPPKREPTLAERRAANYDILTGNHPHELDITTLATRVDSATVHPLPIGLREQGADDVGSGRPDGPAANVG